VTGYGPPDDPSEAPTGQMNYSDYGQQQPEPESTPWHRKPAVLIRLGVVAAILIALVIFGILELTKGGGSTSPRYIVDDTSGHDHDHAADNHAFPK
jgi:hypothetical protein